MPGLKTTVYICDARTKNNGVHLWCQD